MQDEVDQQAKELLDPILSVFAGEDGGVSFARLRQEFIPHLIMDSKTNVASSELLTMITQFSRLSKMALERKI